jgi:hypothetical protein
MKMGKKKSKQDYWHDNRCLTSPEMADRLDGRKRVCICAELRCARTDEANECWEHEKESRLEGYLKGYSDAMKDVGNATLVMSGDTDRAKKKYTDTAGNLTLDEITKMLGMPTLDELREENVEEETNSTLTIFGHDVICPMADGCKCSWIKPPRVCDNCECYCDIIRDTRADQRARGK